MRGSIVAHAALLALCGLVLATPRPAKAQAALLSPGEPRAPLGRESDSIDARLLIRERRVADDRETRTVIEFTTRIKRVEADRDRARQDAQVAAQRAGTLQAALDDEKARNLRAMSLNALSAQDQRDFHDAMARFAAGDRIATWPTIERLTQARVVALGTNVAAAAEAVVYAAELRGVMRDNKEATADDVLAFWDRASRLDPASFRANLQRAAFLLSLGRFADAQSAVDAAARGAVSDLQNAVVLVVAGSAAVNRGDVDKGLGLLERGQRLLRSAATEQPANAHVPQLLVATLVDIGQTLRIAGKGDAARLRFDESLRLIGRLESASPGSPALQSLRYQTLIELGALTLAARDAASATKHYAESLTIIRREVAARPAPDSLLLDMVSVLGWLADAQAAQGDMAAARQATGEMVDVIRRLAGSDPTDLRRRQALWWALNRHGEQLRESGDAARAVQQHEDALLVARALSAQDPSSTKWQHLAADSLGSLGLALMDKGDARAAVERRGEGLALRRRTVSAEPETLDNLWRLAGDLGVLGYLELRYHRQLQPSPGASEPGRRSEAQAVVASAVRHLKEGVILRRRIAGMDANAPEAQQALAFSLRVTGDALNAGSFVSNSRRHEDNSADRLAALRCFEESLAIYRRAAVGKSGDVEAQRTVAELLERLGSMRDDVATGVAELEESLAIRRRLLAAKPGDEDLQTDLVWGIDSMLLHAESSDFEFEARRLGLELEALGIERTVGRGRPDDAQHQDALVTRLRRIATNLTERGEFDAAVVQLRECVAAYRRLASGDPARGQGLAFSLEELGATLIHLGQVSEGGALLIESVETLRRGLAAVRVTARDPTDRLMADRIANAAASLATEGRYDDALMLLDEAIVLRRRVVRASADDLPGLRYLAHVLGDTGRVLAALGRQAEARSRFDESLAILQRANRSQASRVEPNLARSYEQEAADTRLRYEGWLAERGAYESSGRDAEERARAFRAALGSHPAVSRLQEFAKLLEQAAEALAEEGASVRAQRHADESVAVWRRLANADPRARETRIELATALARTGTSYAADGRLPLGAMRLKESLSISKRLLTADPTSARLLRQHVVALLELGNVEGDEGAEARPRYEEALTFARRLAAASPASAEAQRLVATSLWRLAELDPPAVTWAAVASQFDVMRGRGVLAPADESFAREALSRAARPTHPKPKPAQ